MRVDTHTHSTASDSTVSPSDLMFEAAAAGLDGIALTDHDTVAGWDEASAQVRASGVFLIRGLEFTTVYHHITVHMLGYLFNPDDAQIQDHIHRMGDARYGRARRMVDKISRDFPLTWEDVVAQTKPGAPVGRPHIADAMVAKGIVENRAEAFERYLYTCGPYYEPNYAPDSLDVVEWINGAGGKAVFAHPLTPQRNKMVPLDSLDEFREAGLFGVEVDHPENDPRFIPELVERAHRLGLARFGSSDYHGAGKPNRLGEHVTAPAVVEDLVAGSFLEVLQG